MNSKELSLVEVEWKLRILGGGVNLDTKVERRTRERGSVMLNIEDSNINKNTCDLMVMSKKEKMTFRFLFISAYTSFRILVDSTNEILVVCNKFLGFGG